MEEHYHPPLEEDLEAIHSLQEEGTPVIQARIAQRLGRSAPSVSEMLGRLSDEGDVRREGRVVEFTTPGANLAAQVVRRHRLGEVETGTTVRLERITEDVEVDMGSLVSPDEHGFVPGSTAVVSSRAADGTLMLEVGESTVAFGSCLSHRLFAAAV